VRLTYHVKHPRDRSMLSQFSREDLAQELAKAETWPAGRYKVYLLQSTSDVGNQEDYYCGFGIKQKNGSVEFDEATDTP
jgi:hypothetical protein